MSTVHKADNSILDHDVVVTNYREMDNTNITPQVQVQDPEAFHNKHNISSCSDPIKLDKTDKCSTKIVNLCLIESNSSKEDNFQDDQLSSFVSTVMTADGIADPVSFKVNCLIVFLGDMTRGIFFPTMWNLVQTLDGDQVLLGYVIASFSFGRMLVLPLFGSWSIQYGYKWTLQISTFILLIGTLLFSQVLNVRKQWFLIFANTVLGIGSGTLGVTFAYSSEVTPKRKRTGYLAWVSAVQYAGTTATPFIGSLFVVLFVKQNDDDDDANYKG